MSRRRSLDILTKYERDDEEEKYRSSVNDNNAQTAGMLNQNREDVQNIYLNERTEDCKDENDTGRLNNESDENQKITSQSMAKHVYNINLAEVLEDDSEDELIDNLNESQEDDGPDELANHH